MSFYRLVFHDDDYLTVFRFHISLQMSDLIFISSLNRAYEIVLKVMLRLSKYERM